MEKTAAGVLMLGMSKAAWEVFDYESQMLRELGRTLQDHPSGIVHNAATESMALHVRLLCDLFLGSKDARDLKLGDLIPAFTPARQGDLRTAYKTGTLPPKQIINSMLMHLGRSRTSSHNYTSLINLLRPILLDIIAEVEAHRPPPK